MNVPLTLEAKNVLCRYLTDLRALERYLIEALELQEFEKDLRSHREAALLVSDTLDLLRYHVAKVDEEIESLDCDPRSALRRSVAAISGAFVTSVSKLRSRETSKILRDNLTMLNLATASYAILHSGALAVGHTALADLALIHLRELTGIIAEINQLLPRVVVAEVARTVATTSETAADRAFQNTESAWGREAVAPTPLPVAVAS